MFVPVLCCFLAAVLGTSLASDEADSSLLPIRIANRDGLRESSAEEENQTWQYLGSGTTTSEGKMKSLRRDNRVDQSFFEDRRFSNEIDSSASVPFLTSTMPSFPSNLIGFSLVRARNESLSGPGRNRVAFDHVFTDVNEAWDEERAAFRCRTPGLYFFSFNARGEAEDDQPHWMVALMLNGVEVVSIGGTNESSASNSILLPLNAHDQVWLQVLQGRILEDFDMTKTGMTSFSGFRIGGMGDDEEKKEVDKPKEENFLMRRPWREEVQQENQFERRRPYNRFRPSYNSYENRPPVYYPHMPERNNHVSHHHESRPFGERRDGYLPPFTSLAEAAQGKYPDHPRRTSSYLDRDLEERRRRRQQQQQRPTGSVLVRRRGGRKQKQDESQ